MRAYLISHKDGVIEFVKSVYKHVMENVDVEGIDRYLKRNSTFIDTAVLPTLVIGLASERVAYVVKNRKMVYPKIYIPKPISTVMVAMVFVFLLFTGTVHGDEYYNDKEVVSYQINYANIPNSSMLYLMDTREVDACNSNSGRVIDTHITNVRCNALKNMVGINSDGRLQLPYSITAEDYYTKRNTGALISYLKDSKEWKTCAITAPAFFIWNTRTKLMLSFLLSGNIYPLVEASVKYGYKCPGTDDRKAEDAVLSELNKVVARHSAVSIPAPNFRIPSVAKRNPAGYIIFGTPAY